MLGDAAAWLLSDYMPVWPIGGARGVCRNGQFYDAHLWAVCAQRYVHRLGLAHRRVDQSLKCGLVWRSQVHVIVWDARRHRGTLRQLALQVWMRGIAKSRDTSRPNGAGRGGPWRNGKQRERRHWTARAAMTTNKCTFYNKRGGVDDRHMPLPISSTLFCTPTGHRDRCREFESYVGSRVTPKSRICKSNLQPTQGPNNQTTKPTPEHTYQR